MHSSALSGRTALVTGASAGLGRATAIALARVGLNVVVGARTEARLSGVIAEIRALGRDSVAFAADLGDGAAVDAALAALPCGVDVLVNNAAVVDPLGPTATVTAADWERAMAVNVLAPARLCSALLGPMIGNGWGRIVNISSGAARGTGMRGGNAYSVSKAALEHHTKNLAAELAGTGVTVNAVRPGTVDTDMQVRMRGAGDELDPEVHGRFVGLHENGELTDPDEPAAYIATLVTRTLTGQVLDVRDGPVPSDEN